MYHSKCLVGCTMDVSTNEITTIRPTTQIDIRYHEVISTVHVLEYVINQYGR